MKYGLVIPNVGAYSDVRALAELAHQAEESGWDGVFLWDTIHYLAENQGVSDPWIALAAVAMRTERIKIGHQVAVPPRRRPWKLARETVTLDHLSNGRFILGIGVGDVTDNAFGAFGEEMDAKKRAGMLDESLAILQGLWSGKPFSYSGEYYQVSEITFLPPPVQSAIPIWAGWGWPKKKPMERAARLDGASPFAIHDGNVFAELNATEIRHLKAFVEERRTKITPYDIAVGAPVFEAVQNEQAREVLRANAEAGATWSFQRIWVEEDIDTIRTSIQQGPPVLL